jgi:hypothetical protein
VWGTNGDPVPTAWSTSADPFNVLWESAQGGQ